MVSVLSSGIEPVRASENHKFNGWKFEKSSLFNTYFSYKK